ncbi:DUF1287 domain-containing protein [Tropicibacter sp. R15_0]|uniref:DUF1287 domain-containing protein n=1 Tax=Tropicibacter sp. R15_0 TaxID=2821101 RepID=UPI001ADC1C3B|nr:DUF1287 domain-containing protein [Tropicibacter sp. R15_0]MBO9464218.1 DUF1287 domain-containing protein [Tropicibacter sp. R15_0]
MRLFFLVSLITALCIGTYFHQAQATPPLSDHPPLRLAQAAQTQVGVTLIYDPRYVGLEYPMGDLPRMRGVCTDVVIRAMRDAWGIDLQEATHKDMKAHFAKYPTIWGLKSTDRSIDHRRVPNLEVLLTRAGADLPLSSDPAAFETGDIVSFRLSGSNLPHIGIVSDKHSPDGTPLVTHNIGWGTRTENMLFDHKITGHFRLGKAQRQWLASR